MDLQPWQQALVGAAVIYAALGTYLLLHYRSEVARLRRAAQDNPAPIHPSQRRVEINVHAIPRDVVSIEVERQIRQALRVVNRDAS